MRAIWSRGTPSRTPRHAIYRYHHPLDDCRNGGMRWRVVHDEIAPGLFDIRHPKCSMCLAEPEVEAFEFLDGASDDENTRLSTVVSADGQSIAQERVPMTPAEKALARTSAPRQPSRETESITDVRWFDKD
jgi:hypothetical protein